MIPGFLLFAAVAAPPPVPAGRRADVYAVYSAVLARPSLPHADSSAKYLVVDVTGMAGEGRPDRCFVPPLERRAALAEIMSDYLALRGQSFRLEHGFSASKPYELLTPLEGGSFMDPRRNPPGPALERRFAGAMDLITLGNVYFNRDRTVAVVKTFDWCGTLCAQATWHALEKVAGRWELRDWIHCSEIAAPACRPRVLTLPIPIGKYLSESLLLNLSTFKSFVTNRTILAVGLHSPSHTNKKSDGLMRL
ncbi:MAG: hypothetical protein LAQ30_15220 [Acidobacteriia bacterium]|nr:hypothetical protein [Terriglobia bacterium]